MFGRVIYHHGALFHVPPKKQSNVKLKISAGRKSGSSCFRIGKKGCIFNQMSKSALPLELKLFMCRIITITVNAIDRISFQYNTKFMTLLNLPL